MQHHIPVQYNTSGKCVLAYQQQEIVVSNEIDRKTSDLFGPFCDHTR